MKRFSCVLVALAAILVHGSVIAQCERNVDTVETYYINGMFTDWDAYMANREAISEFIAERLADEGFSVDVRGSHNRAEIAREQALQVARQKYEDLGSEVNVVVYQFINGDVQYLETPEGIAAVQEYLESISAAYAGTYSEGDTRAAITGLTGLLDTCSRVVLVTHSQGNFYGNVVFNHVYASYVFPNGYAIAAYPMLGMMQIASPVYVPGGAAAQYYGDIIGHLTNDNDLVMRMVRNNAGAVDANYNAPFNIADFSGHSLEQAYLQAEGQASEISSQMMTIARTLTPYPLHGQRGSSSSALAGLGYSEISSVLDVAFLSGGVYRYSDVPENIFLGLLNASSQGGYFNEYVRNSYEYSRLE